MRDIIVKFTKDITFDAVGDTIRKRTGKNRDAIAIKKNSLAVLKSYSVNTNVCIVCPIDNSYVKNDIYVLESTIDIVNQETK